VVNFLFSYGTLRQADVQSALFGRAVPTVEVADEYEVDDYARVPVALPAGLQTWVYVAAE